MAQNDRYYRKITETVFRWYLEIEDGHLRAAGPDGCYGDHRIFDERILNYRLDVERALGKLPEAERQAILQVHRDGYSIKAASGPGVNVAAVEAKAGRLFEQFGVDDLVRYLTT